MSKLQAQPEAKTGSTGQSMPPAGKKSVRFIVGTILMTSSFLVYPAYPVILLWLPLSASTKAGVSVAVWILSWSTFSLGGFLAGPDGYAWFKGLWQRMTSHRGESS
jgi:hypothetical protein